MSTPFDALDWRGMSQQERDLGLNNGVAVPGSADIVAGWERRSADMRKRHSDHLDLRYGTARSQPDRFPQGRGERADTCVHSWRLLAAARQGSLHGLCRRADGAWHQRRTFWLYADAGCDARSDRRRNS